MTGNEGGRILDSCIALEHRFDKIPGGTDSTDKHTGQKDRQHRKRASAENRAWETAMLPASPDR